jgi:hypothetical protein
MGDSAPGKKDPKSSAHVGGSSASKAGQHSEGNEQLERMERMFAHFMSQMESSQENFRSELQAINSKVEAISLRDQDGPEFTSFQAKAHRGNRVSFGGGEAAPLFVRQEDLESPEKKIRWQLTKKFKQILFWFIIINSRCWNKT